MKKYLKVRVSDNVLGIENRTILELTMDNDSNGVLQVVEQEVTYQGVYYPQLAGMKFKDLLAWVQQDPTGQHPEVYNEIWDTFSWRSFIDKDRLYGVMERYTKEKKLLKEIEKGNLSW
jgi:hypothetical protein